MQLSMTWWIRIALFSNAGLCRFGNDFLRWLAIVGAFGTRQSGKAAVSLIKWRNTA